MMSSQIWGNLLATFVLGRIPCAIHWSHLWTKQKIWLLLVMPHAWGRTWCRMVRAPCQVDNDLCVWALIVSVNCVMLSRWRFDYWLFVASGCWSGDWNWRNCGLGWYWSEQNMEKVKLPYTPSVKWVWTDWVTVLKYHVILMLEVDRGWWDHTHDIFRLHLCCWVVGRFCHM